MKDQKVHRLLKRQLKKAEFNASDMVRYSAFLEQINNAYFDFDKDLMHIEHILEESSKELFKANNALKVEYTVTKDRLKKIVNTIDGVLFQTDMKGNFIFLNKAWEDITGLSVKKSLNKNFREFLYGLNKSEKSKIEKLLSKKRDNYNTVFKYYTPFNEKKYIELNLSLTKDTEENPTGTIGTMTDVTDLKQTEIELYKANKAKDDFLSTISHEMRTPLNAVIGLANVMLMNDHLPEQLENLEALKFSGKHLLKIIDDVLDLNKVQSGEIELEETEFCLSKFLKGVQSNFKTHGKDKFLVFRVQRQKSIPDYLIGDSHKLAQVLKNLLGNAFKFTESGAIVLSVKLKETKSNQVKLLFEVKDTGIGIAKNKQRDIFKRFVQAESNTTRLYGGTGLGLSISRKLLQLQGSFLKLNSKPNIGSTFSFELDFKISKNKNNQRSVVKNAISSTKELKLKVLVAEDNKLNIMVLKKLFKKWEIDYQIAENGQELLFTYEKEDFDLILMDLQMPILDGYETTKRIRQLKDPDKANIPIIALTAFAQKNIKEKTEKYKMNGYMSKPFDAHEFHKLLQFFSKEAQKVG